MSDNPPAQNASLLEDRSISRGLTSDQAETLSSEVARSGPVDNELFNIDLRNQLFHESHAAKVWKVAQDFLKPNGELIEYPEHVQRHGQNAGRYQTKPVGFWTCAFLPGCLYSLLERCRHYPQTLPLHGISRDLLDGDLLRLCRAWIAPLHGVAFQQNTHDLGFMTMPLRMDWNLTGNHDSLSSVATAANSLASRFCERVGAIRSWDIARSRAYNLSNQEEDFLVIIDSMCNLELLFYVGNYIGDSSLIRKAISHAQLVQRTLVRSDFSTFHVVNLNPRSGDIKMQFTHQGYNDQSCWTRGQAWGMLGFTQTYLWTRDRAFLTTAISISNYFIERLTSLSHDGPFVPPWDFDAPPESNGAILRDTSAGMIAANALLLLHQAMRGISPYLGIVSRIVQDTLRHSMAGDHARFEVGVDHSIVVNEMEWDGILMHSTANNNEHAHVPYSDVGLIYADYYFLELGNKLIRMGLI